MLQLGSFGFLSVQSPNLYLKVYFNLKEKFRYGAGTGMERVMPIPEPEPVPIPTPISRLGKWAVRVGCLFGSGQLRIKCVPVGYGFGLGEVRIRIYFGSIMFGSGMGSVRLKSRSGLFWMVLR